MNRRLFFAGMAVAAAAFAQTTNAPVPAAEQATYTQLQGELNTFTQTITSQWNGTKVPFIFGGELLDANSNSGLELLAAGVRDKYLQEMNALKGLGIQAVTVKMGYPFLYQPFLQYNGDPQDYPAIIAFYQQVVSDAHAAGLKVIVESASIFPGFFSAGSMLNVTGYYGSITYDEYITGVAAMNNTIVTQIKPDYLNVGSEPDTEAENTGFTQLETPSGWAAAVAGYISTLPQPHSIPVGAGIGTWQIANASEFVSALAPTVDYFDFHVYPVNSEPGQSISIPTNTINVITQAESLGKKAAISEAWLLKSSDSQYTGSNVASSEQTFSQDAFSFWAPLDQSFLNAMYDLANWKGLTYMSAFWTKYFWSYLDYNAVGSDSAAVLTQSSEQAAATALSSGQVTSTGLFVKSLLVNSVTPTLGIASAASYSATSGVAPGSIAAIFGSSLASTASATGTTLPTTLGGASVTFTDAAGTKASAGIFYASATQLNVLVPTGLASGTATVTVSPSSGSAITGTVTIAPVAPGLFAENGTGEGTAAAEILTIQSNGTYAYAPVFSTTAPYNPVAIAFAPGAQVYLVLYGTGISGRSSIANVSALVGSQTLPVVYAGTQSGFAGVDQVNVLLPSSLAGTGVVTVQLTVDGITSNTVQIKFQ